VHSPRAAGSEAHLILSPQGASHTGKIPGPAPEATLRSVACLLANQGDYSVFLPVYLHRALVPCGPRELGKGLQSQDLQSQERACAVQVVCRWTVGSNSSSRTCGKSHVATMKWLDPVLSCRRSISSRNVVPAQPGGWLTTNIRLGRRQVVVALALALGDVAALLAATLIARLIAGRSGGVNFASIDRLDVPLIVACALAIGLYQACGSAPCERLRLRTNAVLVFASVKLAICLVSVGNLEVLLYCMLQSGLLLLSGFYVELVVRWALIDRGLWDAPTLIVGAPDRVRAVCQSLALQPDLGLRPIATLSPSASENDELARPGSLPAIDQTSDLYRFGEQAEVVLATPEGRAVIDALDFGGLRLPRPLLLGDAEALEGVVRKGCGSRDLWIKRALDLAIAIPAGILSWPLVGIILLAVKVIDPGPALYIQNRIGRNGHPFVVFKIRSMYLGAEQRLQEHLARNPAARAEWERFVKLRYDPRVLAGIGSFIRRYSLDELPQLWNVIRGDMSLVGPRPFPDYHVAKFDAEFQKVRSSVTPGLTGLWQVSSRSAGDLMVQRALDLFYIRNWSIWLDLYILLETLPAVLAARGAR